jgi:hypothetical protein
VCLVAVIPGMLSIHGNGIFRILVIVARDDKFYLTKLKIYDLKITKN